MLAERWILGWIFMEIVKFLMPAVFIIISLFKAFDIFRDIHHTEPFQPVHRRSSFRHGYASKPLSERVNWKEEGF